MRTKQITAGRKINRNSTCPCGSNKKYKNCCLKIVEEQERMQLIEKRNIENKK